MTGPAPHMEARAQGLKYGLGKFPWAASGRALGNDRSEGFTKLIFDRASRRLIGAGITGPQAGDLIAECALARAQVVAPGNGLDLFVAPGLDGR